MQKELWLYRLTDATGKQTITVVDDPSDSGCIGGTGSDGQYHQYDSYELWHAYSWAEERGMKLQSGKLTINVPDALFEQGVS